MLTLPLVCCWCGFTSVSEPVCILGSTETAAVTLSRRPYEMDGDHEQPIDGQASSRRVGNCVEFKTGDLHGHLIYSLCGGFFLDPHTVVECLHTFCRSCLTKNLMTSQQCPKCPTRATKSQFGKEIIADRTLDEIVNKIFPHFRARDKEDEANFYEERGIRLKPDQVPEVSERPTKIMKRKKTADDWMEIKVKTDDQIARERRLGQVHNDCLCLSSRAKVSTLKKYLAKQLQVKDHRSLEVTCNGVPMGDEYNLNFIQRTRWMNPEKSLELKYRLQLDAVGLTGNYRASA